MTDKEQMFPVVSSCHRCQALHDGRRFFELVEQAAAGESLTVDRFLSGLRESLAIASVIAASLDLDTHDELTAAQIAQLANDAAAELARSIIARGPSQALDHEVH